jgi:hypothetical protein
MIPRNTREISYPVMGPIHKDDILEKTMRVGHWHYGEARRNGLDTKLANKYKEFVQIMFSLFDTRVNMRKDALNGRISVVNRINDIRRIYELLNEGVSLENAEVLRRYSVKFEDLKSVTNKYIQEEIEKNSRKILSNEEVYLTEIINLFDAFLLANGENKKISDVIKIPEMADVNRQNMYDLIDAFVSHINSLENTFKLENFGLSQEILKTKIDQIFKAQAKRLFDEGAFKALKKFMINNSLTYKEVDVDERAVIMKLAQNRFTAYRQKLTQTEMPLPKEIRVNVDQLLDEIAKVLEIKN